MSEFRRRLLIANAGGAEPPTGYIKFADPEVERICVANFSSDGIGVTYEDAAKVTALPSVKGMFRENTLIQSFNELRYFTGIEGIKNGTFFKSTNMIINDATLPKCKTVGGGAFNSTKVKSLSLSNCTIIFGPSNGTRGCFENSALESIQLGTIGIIGTDAFRNCSKLKHIGGLQSVTEIGSHSFDGVAEFNSLSELKNVTKIGVGAFKGVKFTDTTIVNLPNLKDIGLNSGTFYNTKITRVENLGSLRLFGKGSESLSGTFRDCKNLTFVRLPSTFEKADTYNELFIGCVSLITIICEAKIPPIIEASTLSKCPLTDGIYVPDASVDDYKTAPNWSTYASKIKPLSHYKP